MTYCFLNVFSFNIHNNHARWCWYKSDFLHVIKILIHSHRRPEVKESTEIGDVWHSTQFPVEIPMKKRWCLLQVFYLLISPIFSLNGLLFKKLLKRIMQYATINDSINSWISFKILYCTSPVSVFILSYDITSDHESQLKYDNAMYASKL